jgi:hypothetical protein
MALSKEQLKQRIVSNLESFGFVCSGEYASADKMAEAIASAVVDEIQANAEVPVSGGSSAGTYNVT